MNIHVAERSGTVPSGKVVVATNIKREREMFDKFGNVINPVTKAVIRRADEQ